VIFPTCEERCTHREKQQEPAIGADGWSAPQRRLLGAAGAVWASMRWDRYGSKPVFFTMSESNEWMNIHNCPPFWCSPGCWLRDRSQRTTVNLKNKIGARGRKTWHRFPTQFEFSSPSVNTWFDQFSTWGFDMDLRGLEYSPTSHRIRDPRIRGCPSHWLIKLTTTTTVDKKAYHIPHFSSADDVC
jgi:hypothetical protein